MSKKKAVSQAVEDYLKTIYHLKQEEASVTTKAISEEMGISAASVTNMVKKLVKMGILHHTPYQEITLNRRGEKIALAVIRRHRLLETFLKEVLGYRLDQIHEEAERLEHVISEKFVKSMDEVLDRPATDPHGSPIPSQDGKIVVPYLIPLTSVDVGQSAVIRRLSHRDPERLQYMENLGLLPNVEIKILEKKPFKGPLLIQIQAKRKEIIGHNLAEQIWVRFKNK